jgi:hypothetical protein
MVEVVDDSLQVIDMPEMLLLSFADKFELVGVEELTDHHFNALDVLVDEELVAR